MLRRRFLRMVPPVVRTKPLLVCSNWMACWLRDVVIERTERQLVGASFYVVNKRDFVLFEVEEGDEHASFQLGHALDAELGKPLLQFHEVYLVASGSQVVSQLDDSSEIDSVSQHSIYVCHDDAQQINGLDRGIDGVAFVFLYLD